MDMQIRGWRCRRASHHGVPYIVIWVDASLLIRHEAMIQETIDDLKASGFGLKIEGEIGQVFELQDVVFTGEIQGMDSPTTFD